LRVDHVDGEKRGGGKDGDEMKKIMKIIKSIFYKIIMKLY
jgi:hypothetical protein